MGEMPSLRSPSELGLEPRVLSGSKFRAFSTKVGKTRLLRVGEDAGGEQATCRPTSPAFTVPSLVLETSLLEVPDVLSVA